MRILLSLATAIAILAVALVLLLTPIWTHFALGAVGNGDEESIWYSDQTVNHLVLGPGTFEIDVCDAPPRGCATPSPRPRQLYTADEQGHMRDVRVVLYGFLLLAVVSLVFVGASLVRAPRDGARWKAVSRGGVGLIVAMVVLGVFAFVAFDTAFLLFHEIFFPGGNFSFDANSSLIRLYPELFWELSAAALGILASFGALVVWLVARRRAAALTTAGAAA